MEAAPCFHKPNGMQIGGEANPHMKTMGMFQQMVISK
jgi:hypothetical protein